MFSNQNPAKKVLPTTAVCRNCENFAKLTNFFRKKFYLSRKLYGYEVRNFCKPPNVGSNGSATDKKMMKIRKIFLLILVNFTIVVF
jgi:hypothetical protein